MSDDIVVQERLSGSLADIAVEIFRLEQAMESVITNLSVDELERFRRKTRYSISRIQRVLDDHGIKTSTPPEGSCYDTGMPSVPLNIDEFDLDADRLVIDQVLEPTVMQDVTVLRAGTVLLRKDK
jgi:hypothetical protein